MGVGGGRHSVPLIDAPLSNFPLASAEADEEVSADGKDTQPSKDIQQRHTQQRYARALRQSFASTQQWCKDNRNFHDRHWEGKHRKKETNLCLSLPERKITPLELETEKDSWMWLNVAMSNSLCLPAYRTWKTGLFVPDVWQRCLDRVTATQKATMQHWKNLSGTPRCYRNL